MNSQTVVLFDLDHTLYEAYWSWRKPLATLFRHSLGTKRFPWGLYFAVRGQNEVFDIFYEKSFRHYWLTPELAAVLILLLEKKIPATAFLSELGSLRFELNLLKRVFPRPGAYSLAARQLCRRFPVFQSALNGAKELSASQRVRDLVSRYHDSLRFRPYDGTVEALDFLRERDVAFYLASEGDYGQQSLKCELLGFRDYFSGRILASETYRLNPHYQRSRKVIAAAIADGTYEAQMDSAVMQRADEDIRRFELLTHKEAYHYYLSILKAIGANAENPERFLKESPITDILTTELDAAFSVVMVGDRDDKDMYPVWQLLKSRALLIRMRTGKYQDDPRSPGIPRAHYVECSDFRQVHSRLRRTFREGAGR